MTEPASAPTWVPLSPRERRVLGVLVEKQKTTPDNYPMTVNAIVSGSNQKSARDPQTNYDADDVEETLQTLRKRGAATLVEGVGRAVKWKHNLYEWLDLKDRPTELAIVAELMLRGPQTEGDLRARASRMAPLPDLPTLQEHLQYLARRELILFLTPSTRKRGVMVSHNMYPPEELGLVRQAITHIPGATYEPARSTDPDATPPPASQDWVDDLSALRAEVEAMKAMIQTLTAEVRDLKTSLGA